MTQVSVPNKFPRIEPTTARLAIVGEAPGADESVMLEPFVGASGRLLKGVLSSAGAVIDQTFFGNVCQQQPFHNEIENFSFDESEIQSGLTQLRIDLQNFRPNCVLLVGKTAFRAFRPDLCHPSKKGYVIPTLDWRGSIISGVNDFSYKCVGTYHPAYILRSYSDMPLFKLDVARAVKQSRFSEIRATSRIGNLRPSLCEVLSFIARVRSERLPIAFDIEGYADDVGITMLSICDSPTSGIVIPFWSNGQNYWPTVEDEVEVWKALAGLLADPDVPKTAHNAFYELFVMAWRHRCIVNNLRDDTMQKTWELFPELERSLAICTSIYTEQPFYKDQRLASDPTVRLNYNFLDSAVTYEINQVLETKLSQSPKSLQHYRFNTNLIPAYNYIMLRGCAFNQAKALDLALTATTEVDQLKGEIEKTLGRPFNVKSVVDKRWLLYTHLDYTPLKRYGLSTAEDILLHYHAKTHNPILRLVIRCTRKRTRLSDINKLTTDADGRIRTSYDPVGTNTGRVSSRASIALRLVDGAWENTGTNMQNVTKELRQCFIADSEEYEFWQLDLSGADGWTVAADLAALGYPAMLEDYRYKIKPALVLYYMLREHAAGRDASSINLLDRPTLKLKLIQIKEEIDANEGKFDAQGRPLDWLYLCCKRVQHGSNYGAKPEKIAEVIFGDSDGTVDISAKDAGIYQFFYKLRYKTDARNERIRRALVADGSLTAACGIRRQFFSIRSRTQIDDSTIREASAFEPQANTTYATNLALSRLWYDPENRTSRGSLFIEPLLQIHDALAGQYRKCDREWAWKKLQEWFNNPMKIYGSEITIPADGGFGPNWMETKQHV